MRHSIRHYPDSDFLFNSFRYREYEGSTVDFICSRGGAHSDSDIVTVFMYIEAEKGYIYKHPLYEKQGVISYRGCFLNVLYIGHLTLAIDKCFC